MSADPIRTIVAGNWKMNKTAAQTAAFFEAFLPRVPDLPAQVEIVVAPPFTALARACRLLRETRVHLGAQTMHWELSGAFTGEIGAPMLREFNVTHVILGHSERREFCAEADFTVNLKVKTALAQGLTPIVAVGETLLERDAGITDERVVSQIRAAFDGIAAEELARVAVAYEPIWAIGTGRSCDPAEAGRVCGTIRAALPGLARAPILYGGSMNAANANAYVAQTDINGGLVGGASLDPATFAALIANAGGSPL